MFFIRVKDQLRHLNHSIILAADHPEDVKVIDVKPGDDLDLWVYGFNLFEVLMIDKLVVLEDNYIVFGNEFVPAGTDVLEFVSILECKGFTLMIPGSDKDKFGNLRMLDVL
jgi:hypothetical protein